MIMIWVKTENPKCLSMDNLISIYCKLNSAVNFANSIRERELRPDDVHHDLARVRLGAMFEKIDTLPRAEQHASAGNGD